MNGFVKVGFHPLSGTRVGPKAAPADRASRVYKPLQPATEPAEIPVAPKAAGEPKRSRGK